ncbi:MAG: glycosyl hydrolase family 28 protein [Bacteroidota bacterium]
MRALALFLALATTVAAQDCLVTDYGAVPNDGMLDTAAIQAAVDDCAERGGGTVRVPAGTFDTGTVRLASFVHLHLNAGALLRGSTDLADYPFQPELTSERPGRRRALLAAFGAKHVALTGTGTIDGRGPEFAYDAQTGDETEGRPMFWVVFQDVRDLTIRDVRMVNSTGWTLNLNRVERVSVRGITIDNPPLAPNTDGIDLRGARDVTISNVTIRTGDDAICFKARRGQPVENVVVTNAVLASDDAAIKFGTRTGDRIAHVLVQNVAIRDTRYGIAVFMKDGGAVEQVRIENVTFGGEPTRHGTEYPVYLDIDRRDETSPLGTVRDVTLAGLDLATRGNVLIAGRPDAPIERLTLRDVTLRVTEPADLDGRRKPGGIRGLGVIPGSVNLASVDAHLTLGHIRGLTLRDVSVLGPGRRPFHVESVTGLRADGLALSSD